jgi:hypothetical protein
MVSSQQRNSSAAGWGEGEALQRVGYKGGNLGLCCYGWQTVGSAPDENHFTVPRTRRVYDGAVFEAKKEIPDETNKNVALSIRTLHALPGVLRRVPVRPDFVRPDYAATPALDPRCRRPTGQRRRQQLRPGCRSGG